MSRYTHGLERFTFASQAAAQGERDGFYYLGVCVERGEGCERDLEKAKENYLLAAKMGHVAAMDSYGELLDESDPQRWQWLGLAAARGSAGNFLRWFLGPVNRFESDPSLAPVVFMIGRVLRGHVNSEKGEIFGQSYDFARRIGPANRAIDFFTSQCDAARKAVDVCCLMARRFDGLVNRDIRKKIGMMIWEAREQANYPLQKRKEPVEPPGHRCLQ
jgi:TPR repeat protein